MSVMQLMKCVVCLYVVQHVALAADDGVFINRGGGLPSLVEYSNLPLVAEGSYEDTEYSVRATPSDCSVSTRRLVDTYSSGEKCRAQNTVFVHLKPGCMGPVSVAVNPYLRYELDNSLADGDDWNSRVYVDGGWTWYQWHTNGGGGSGGQSWYKHKVWLWGGPIPEQWNELAPVTIQAEDGDKIAFLYEIDTAVQSVIGLAAQTFWFTVDLSSNAYFTTTNDMPTPTAPPTVKCVQLVATGTNATFCWSGLPTNETFSSYRVDCATNLASIHDGWAEAVTGLLSAASLTNTIPVSGNRMEFFRLQVLP